MMNIEGGNQPSLMLLLVGVLAIISALAIRSYRNHVVRPM